MQEPENKIGGEGKIVRIDLTLIAKKKNCKAMKKVCALYN